MHQSNVMAMMVSLQRRLDHFPDGNREREFFSNALQSLTTVSGRQMEMENWMITSYEVEFGPQIGFGGLYGFRLSMINFTFYQLMRKSTSGQVFMGTWNETPVALKVLTTQAGISPSSAVRRHSNPAAVQILMS
jgi:hypothetical protein